MWVLTGFRDRACRGWHRFGHHPHRQAGYSLGKDNPSWAIFGSVCICQSPAQAKQRAKLLKTFKGLYEIGEILVFLMASESMIKNRTVAHYSNAYVISHHMGWV